MRILAPALAAVLLTAPALAQQRPTERPGAHAELSAGAEYQTGDYGTGEEIETTSITSTARVAAGRVIVTASLPYLRVDAPGNVVAGSGGLLGLPIVVDPTQPATRVRRQGLGDLRLGAAVMLPTGPAVDLAVYGQVKLPTASRRARLGTGEVDYAMGAELSKTVAGVTPFASLTYTVPGKPADYALRNSLSGQAGLGARLGRTVSGQLSYGYSQSLSPTIADEQLVSARLAAGVSRRLSLSIYGNAGVSRSAPDVGAGVQLGVRLF